MRTIHEVLNDETSAAVLAQISMHGGKMSAKEIAKNIGKPLTTIYDHLRALERDEFIYAEKIQVKNLIKKVWNRTEKRITTKDQTIKNEIYSRSFHTDPRTASSYVKYLIGYLQEKINRLESIDQETFKQFQKTSETPYNVLQLILTRDDYKYVFQKIVEIHFELQKRNPESMNPDRQHALPEERYMFFYLAIPDLDMLEKL